MRVKSKTVYYCVLCKSPDDKRPQFGSLGPRFRTKKQAETELKYWVKTHLKSPKPRKRIEFVIHRIESVIREAVLFRIKYEK